MLLREAPVLVPIFDRGTESLRQTVSRFLMKFMKQIAPQARFFGLNPDVYKFLTEFWTNCISSRER